jgi:hypothetical protein
MDKYCKHNGIPLGAYFVYLKLDSILAWGWLYLDETCRRTKELICQFMIQIVVFIDWLIYYYKLLFCFTSRILREIACSRKKSLLSNILLIFYGLKCQISNTCPYFFCAGCIIVQQHTHCRNFRHFTFFFLSSCPSHLSLLTRPNNIMQTGDPDFAEDIPLCLCT